MRGAAAVHEHGHQGCCSALQLTAVLCNLLPLSYSGVLKLPMPHPAHESYIHQWPKEAPFPSTPPDVSINNISRGSSSSSRRHAKGSSVRLHSSYTLNHTLMILLRALQQLADSLAACSGAALRC
jgi:hypothetical protein